MAPGHKHCWQINKIYQGGKQSQYGWKLSQVQKQLLVPALVVRAGAAATYLFGCIICLE